MATTDKSQGKHDKLPISARIINWIKDHPTQITAVIFWTVAIFATRQYMQANELGFGDLITQLSDLLTGTWYGPLIYIGIYLLRPLILFPASLLTLLAGNVFGLGFGFLYALIAGTASSVIPYSVGRWFSSEEEAKEEVAEDGEESRIEQFTGLLRKNPFQAVLTMRLLYFPYDAVSLIVGALRIAFLPFFIATALGNIAGTFVVVSAGASIQGDIASADISIDPTTIALSITVLVISLVISQVLKRYQDKSNDDSANASA